MIGWHLMAMLILNRWKMEQQLREEDHPEDKAKRDDDRRDAKNDGDKNLGDEVRFVWDKAIGRKSPWGGTRAFAPTGSWLTGSETVSGRIL